MKSVEVIAPGSTVGIHGQLLAGKVIAVAIRSGGNIQYEVAWMDGNTRSCDWLDASEVVQTNDQAEMQIGFK